MSVQYVGNSLSQDECRIFNEFVELFDKNNFSTFTELYKEKLSQNPSPELITSILFAANKIFDYSEDLKKISRLFLNILMPEWQKNQPLDDQIAEAKKKGLQIPLAIHMISSWKDREVIEKWDSLDLGDFTQRCSFCYQMMKNGEFRITFGDRFAKLGFLEEVAAQTDSAKRIVMCGMLGSLSDHVKKKIEQNFATLGFISDILSLKDVSDRLFLCKEISSLGSFAVKGLLAHFHLLGLEEATLEQRIQLSQAFLLQGADAAEGVAHHFEAMGLNKAPPEQLLSLFNEIVLKGGGGALFQKIDRLGIRTIPLEQRLEFYRAAAAMSDKNAVALVDHFDHLALEEASLEERLALMAVICGKVAGSFPRIYDVIQKLGLLEDLVACKTFEERLALYKRIFSQGAWGVMGLSAHFGKIGFWKDIAECNNFEERLARIHQIASLYEVTEKLLENFDALGAKTLEERFRLCEMFASLGCGSAYVLLKKIKCIDLQGIPLEQRFHLFTTIAAYGGLCGMYLFEHFTDFQLEGISNEQFIYLCKLADPSKDNLFRSETVVSMIKQGLLKKIKECEAVAVRIEHFRELATLRIFSVYILKEQFHYFEFEKASVEELLSLVNLFKTSIYSSILDFMEEQVLNASRGIIEPKKRLALCRMIALSGEWGACLMAKMFDRLCPDNATDEERMELCKLIASRGADSATVLINNIKKAGLQEIALKERLSLFKIAAQQSIDSYKLSEFLSNLGIVKRIAECQNFQERLALCREIEADLVGNASALAYALKKLGFLGDFLEERDLNKRVSLCKTLSEETEWGAFALVNYLEELELEDLPVETYLSICIALAATNEEAACQLAKDFVVIGQGSASLEQLIALCRTIASAGEGSAYVLVKKIKKFGLDGAEAEQLYSLCLHIISQGEEVACEVVDHLHTFKIKQIPIERRLILYREIVRKGDAAASKLLEKIGDRGIKEAPLEKILDFCQEAAEQSPRISEKLAKCFHKLGVEKAEAHLKLALVKEIGWKSKKAAGRIATHFEKIGLNDERSLLSLAFLFSRLGFTKAWDAVGVRLSVVEEKMRRQFCLELWKPPAYLGDHSYSEFFNSFPDEHAPLVALLKRKERELPGMKAKQQFFDFVFSSKKLTPLHPLIEDISAKEEPLQSTLLDWAVYAAGILLDMDDEAIAALDKSELLLEIYRHKKPLNRYPLMRFLALQAKACPEELLAGKAEKPWIRFTSLLLFPLREYGLSMEWEKRLFKTIARVKDFHDHDKFTSLSHFLLELYAHAPYPPGVINDIAKKICGFFEKKVSRKKRSKSAIKDFVALTNVLNVFGRTTFCQCILAENSDPASFFVNKLSTLFHLPGENYSMRQFLNTFGKFREPNALFAYLRSVKNLPEKDGNAVLQSLGSYVAAVMDGTFPAIRYLAEGKPHLTKVFGAREEIRAFWMESAPPRKTALKGGSKPFDYKGFFEIKICRDRHINPALLPRLAYYLQGGQGEIAEAESAMDQLQNSIIKLCERKIAIEEFLKEVSALSNLPAVFLNDLKALEQGEMAGKYVIMESHDACDLFLLGSEVKGSCLSVEGDSANNKCLMSYLMNGEVKAIAVKEKEEGKMKARSILRLMWDEKQQTPVILLERIYPVGADGAIEEAIVKWALEKARAMKIPVVTKEAGLVWAQEPYKGTVEFLGGGAPFIYSDAYQGKARGDKPFTIAGCKLIRG